MKKLIKILIMDIIKEKEDLMQKAEQHSCEIRAKIQHLSKCKCGKPYFVNNKTCFDCQFQEEFICKLENYVQRVSDFPILKSKFKFEDEPFKKKAISRVLRTAVMWNRCDVVEWLENDFLISKESYENSDKLVRTAFLNSYLEMHSLLLKLGFQQIFL